jgi:hypothetical protein
MWIYSKRPVCGGAAACVFMSARETAMTSVASFPFVVVCIHYPLACLRTGRRGGAGGRRGGADGSLRVFRIVSLVRIVVLL